MSTPQRKPGAQHDQVTAVLDVSLLLVGLALLGFWTPQWADGAPEGRFFSWALARPWWFVAAGVLHAVLGLLVATRFLRSRQRSVVACRMLLVGLGLLVSVAVLGSANHALRLSGDGLLSAKLRQYDDVADQVDTVFIGSSRIYRHLVPQIYDRIRARAGEEEISFNLGVPDMRMLEVLYLAEWAFERSDGIELLIVEATEDPLELPEWNRNAERTVAWHDEKAMARIRRGIEMSEQADARRAALLSAHLEIFQRRMSAVGRGLTLLQSGDWPGLPASQRGYQSLEQNQRHPISEAEAQELVDRWNRLHERSGSWNRSLERLEREPESRTTDPFEQELFAELEALAAANGARVVWIVSPAPRRTPNLVAAAEKGLVHNLLRFDDPSRYPEFYATEGRFDRFHLNEAMAARFTELVAEAVLELEHDAP